MSDQFFVSSPNISLLPTITAPKAVIQVEALYKHYGKLAAVKGIDFSVREGEIFGLIGPDGAGKTTTFHILSGVMEASGGQVTVLRRSPKEARPSIGYLTQKFSLYMDLSIEENLRYSAGLRQVPSHLYERRRSEYLQLMDLEQFSDRLAGRLSGGMKQKLALCCALISQPKILLLDEPTTGIDPVSRREFWDVLAAVAQEGMTIIVATPYLDEAERCHRIALMHSGEIQQIDTPSQLRKSLGLERLEVCTPYLETLENRLTARLHASSIVDVQPFGDRLDVLVKDVKKGEAEIHEICRQERIKLDSVYATEPTLENVFVTRLRSLGQDSPFISFPFTGKRVPHEREDMAIESSSLWKTFGQFPAVKNINLEIRYGEIYGLLGANGAGKTTTIKMLCGLLEATSGEISLAGAKANLRSSKLRQQIGYMSQKSTLYDDLSILQNLEFYCGVYGVPLRLRRTKINWVLEVCGLVGKEQMLTGQLPGGWKQRVAFGASVMHEPEILFLDEPTSGVDPLARRQFWRLINELARSGTAILVTTHYLEEAEQCNRLGFMVAGELVAQGSPSEIKADQTGELVEIVVDYPQEASNILKNHLEAWRVSLFGDRIHLVLLDPASEMSSLQSLLRASNITMRSLRSISFSLEDVFIGIVQRKQVVS
jgi:ABC-2 type transport system ATP-binding protein